MNEETKKLIISIARQIYALPLPELAEVLQLIRYVDHPDANPQEKAMNEMIYTLLDIQESWYCSMLVFLPERFPLDDSDIAWAQETAEKLEQPRSATDAPQR